MKRNPALIPLSHDHHHGLVVARRIQEGIKIQAAPARMQRYVRHFWDTDLARHFHEEETIIFPLLPGDDLVAKALNQHEELRALTGPGATQPEGEAEQIAVLDRFAALLQEHIRLEERQLFPRVQEEVDPVRLAEAGRLVALDHQEGSICWDDEFWKV